MDTKITKSKSTSLWRTLLILASLLIVLFVVRAWIKPTQNMSAQLVYVVEKKTKRIEVSGRATLLPKESSIISVAPAGTVMKIFKNPGDMVIPGDPIVLLNNVQLSSDLAKAKQNLSALEADDRSAVADLLDQELTRESLVIATKNAATAALAEKKAYQKLLEDGVVSKLAADRIYAQADQAHSEHAFAIRRLEQQKIANIAKRQASRERIAVAKSEVSTLELLVTGLIVKAERLGTIAKLDVVLGKRLAQGDAIGELISPELYADIEVAQSDVALINIDSSARIQCPQGEINSTVTTISPRAVSGVMHVKSNIATMPAWIRPDLSCEVTISNKKLNEGLFVKTPLGARANTTMQLSRLDIDDAIVAVRVKFGERYGPDIEILEGLKPGDRILGNMPDEQ